MKRFIFLIVIFALVMGVYAYAEEGILKYTYETALEAAVKNSNQPALDDFNIKAKESALEEARKDASKSFLGGSKQEIAEYRIKKEVVPLEAEADLEIAKKEKLDNERKFKADVYSEMLRFILAKDRYNIKSEKTALSREKYIIDSMQFSEGILSKAEIEDEEISLSIELLELKKLETEMKSVILDAKQKLHVDLSEENEIDFEYALDKVGSRYLIDSFNLDNAINRALSRDTGVYGKKMDLEIARMKFDITKEYLMPENDYYVQKEYELNVAEKALYDESTELEVSIRNTYNELLTAQDSLVLAEKRLELEEARLNSLKVKYEAGILSRRDLIDNEISVLDCKLAVYEAICNFNLKHDSLRNLIGD